MADIVNAVIITTAVDKLHTSINEFNKQTAIQNTRMIHLTLVITALTLVMTVAVVVQIYLTLKIPPPQSSPVSISNNVLRPTSHAPIVVGDEPRH